MFKALRNLFRSAPQPRLAAVPDGTRYYLIGDIHGRLDLYCALIDAIEQDDVARPGAESHVVLLGDLVDRGPDSAGVIARTRTWQQQRSVRVLAGNHEEMFLNSFQKPEVLRHFLKHGGRETVLSYGLSKKQFNAMNLDELFELMPKLIPQADIEYIRDFEEMIIAGDYLFVHAGIDPAVPLNEQKRSDMLWIRDRFQITPVRLKKWWFTVTRSSTKSWIAATVSALTLALSVQVCLRRSCLKATSEGSFRPASPMAAR